MIDLVKFSEWVLEHTRPEIVQINGEDFAQTVHGFKPIKTELSSALEVSTLTSLIEYINTNPDNHNPNRSKYLHIESPWLVSLVWELDQWNRREVCVMAKATAGPTHGKATVATLEPQSYKLEAAIINLLTLFAESSDRDYLVETLSSWVYESQQAFLDDGVSQSITAKKGHVRVGAHEVRNSLNLRPFVSFTELEPAEVNYYIRLSMQNKEPMVSLSPVKNLHWQLDYKKAIRDYLEINIVDNSLPILF